MKVRWRQCLTAESPVMEFTLAILESVCRKGFRILIRVQSAVQISPSTVLHSIHQK